MPYSIIIGNVLTNGITQNANIDFGHTVHNSHTANSKWVGANISLGNFSPSTSWMANGNFDPDFSDQDQIANPSMPISGQV
ncbi:hypothetical protein COE67_08100 [Priestia megaterium]|uniref:spore germination protein n=1 Tax=Priestia megaterium TaxID=1404 RepID=UPI000BEC64E6|nr:spore germination protein [Priestia megaterium]MBE2978298.1 spore germination protein [Priestia megaterium]MED3934552.1 spore germination protein [Priestia megaterium]PED64175.1 hypothetical protein CON20_22955 [Priestia megaterium]PGX43089.1 hypothetical protein COE67_08100 [Priestia megaterium]